MAKPITPTTDAVKILHRRYYKNDPQRQAELDIARVSAQVAQQIYELRHKVGLTLRQLAEQVGTTASVISRLESDDYDGHSLRMLHRVMAVLGYRVEIQVRKISSTLQLVG